MNMNSRGGGMKRLHAINHLCDWRYCCCCRSQRLFKFSASLVNINFRLCRARTELNLFLPTKLSQRRRSVVTLKSYYLLLLFVCLSR